MDFNRKVFIFLVFSIFSISLQSMELENKPEKPPKVPIVYNEKYNIAFFGIEKLHPFDSKKYGKIYDNLIKKQKYAPEQFYIPQEVSDEDLKKVHTPEYLQSLNSSWNLKTITEVPLMFVPNFLLQWKLLSPMKLATQGTSDAAQLALENGKWAINLGGGFHHAKAEKGGGFCVYADIPLAIIKLREQKKYEALKVLYVDLDAHQGNGVASILKEDSDTYIFDVFNQDNYPGDWQSECAIKKAICDIYCRFHSFESQKRYDLSPCNECNERYLKKLEKKLPKSIKEFSPGLIFYNAGTDCYEKDPLGGMKLSQEGIIKRDEIVFKNAITNRIPVCMVLSGGYHPDSHAIISASLKNLKENGLLDIVSKE